MTRKIKLPRKIILVGVGGGSVAILVAVFVFGAGFNTIPYQPQIQGSVIQIPEQIPVDFNVVVDEIPLVIPDPIPFTPAFNTTVTSNSTIPEQIIDQIIPPKTIKLEANVVKIDSNSVKYPETFTFDIKQLALFAEDKSNIDFANGFVELGLVLVTDPGVNLVANGVFDILVDNKTIFADDVTLKADGITASDGKINLKFSNISDLFTFDFATNFEKFPNEATTNLSFIIKSLTITTDKQYGLTDQEIFSMDIFRDDIKVLITDTEGNQIRTNLQDSTLTITSNPTTLYTTQDTWYTCLGQIYHKVDSSASSPIPAVVLGSIKVIDDETGLIVDAGAGTGTVLNIKLYRNHNYTIDHSLVDKPRSQDPFKISTSKVQTDYKYDVWTTADYSVTNGFFSLAGTICTLVSSKVTSPVAGSQYVTSNFPK